MNACCIMNVYRKHTYIYNLMIRARKCIECFSSKMFHLSLCSCYICIQYLCTLCIYYAAGELNIHLSGGRTPFEGRVVVYQGGSWGNICDRNWDLNDAKVVCNQLGFGNAIRATRGGVFSPGSGTLMMSNVGCVGHETAISFCTHNGWRNVGSCTHANDAGVVCSGNRN